MIDVTFLLVIDMALSGSLQEMGLMDLLEKLRANLQHFESSPDFGDGEAVEEIRRHLEVRIREAEGLARMLEGEAVARQGRWFKTEAA